MYAFGELADGIGPWFLAGTLIGGVILSVVPFGFFESYLGHGLAPMLVMAAVATPMYVCATGSTPIAAALALKGLSPGAVLVFLMAGPATNAASLAVVAKILGKKACAVYLLSTVGCSLALGWGVDRLYAAIGADTARWAADAAGNGLDVLSWPASLGLALLFLPGVARRVRELSARFAGHRPVS